MANRVELITDLPESSWGLPSDETYFSTGCEDCPNRTCFKLPFKLMRFDDASDIIEEAPFPTTIYQGSTSSGFFREDQCTGDCERADDIEAVTELLLELNETK